MGIRSRIAFLLVLLFAVGCLKAGSYRRPQRTSGTCEGACRHYMACKRLENERVYEACVLECREIFVDDGVADSETLREYERLDCDEAVAFVEGDSGRGPGE